MTTYSPIAGSQTDAESPITESLMTALANNPLAIAEGDPSAPKIAIDVGGQTAIETDETDPTKVLSPDGAGGVEWTDGLPKLIQSGNCSKSSGPDVYTASFSAALATANGSSYKLFIFTTSDSGAVGEHRACMIGIYRAVNDSGTSYWITQTEFSTPNGVNSVTVNASSIDVEVAGFNGATTAGFKLWRYS